MKRFKCVLSDTLRAQLSTKRAIFKAVTHDIIFAGVVGKLFVDSFWMTRQHETVYNFVVIELTDGIVEIDETEHMYHIGKIEPDIDILLNAFGRDMFFGREHRVYHVVDDAEDTADDAVDSVRWLQGALDGARDNTDYFRYVNSSSEYSYNPSDLYYDGTSWTFYDGKDKILEDEVQRREDETDAKQDYELLRLFKGDV